MTDAEWAALSAYLPTRGRPPRDRRRSWDGIFFIALSTLPWARLPPEFGLGETAHSMLMHAARTGVLERLLIAAAGHPLAPPEMQGLAARVAGAVRRASRQLPAHVLEMALALGLTEAVPFPPELMPAYRERRPDAPPPACRPLRLPAIRRRALRGLPPPRGLAPAPVAPTRERPPAPRRRPKRPGRPRAHALPAIGAQRDKVPKG
jgi:transposase